MSTADFKELLAILDLSRTKIEYAALGSELVGDPDALLFVTFTGDDPAELEATLTDASMLGARAVLPKPFSSRALERAIATALTQGRSDSA